MYLHLFRKVCIVDENIDTSKFKQDTKTLKEDYSTIKQQYPTISRLYDDWMYRWINSNGLKQYNDHPQSCLFFIKQNDILDIIQDYCNYLGLTYDEYLILQKHSDFYLKYILGINIKNDIIKRENFKFTDKKIKKNFEVFPAEYAINCLDQPWAQNKYEHFRICEILEEVRNVQIDFHKHDKKIPDIFSDLIYISINSEEKLKDKNVQQQVLNTLSLIKNVDRLYLPIDEYIKTYPSFGYYGQLCHKFNWPLARHFLETGYRIDSNAK